MNRAEIAKIMDHEELLDAWKAYHYPDPREGFAKDGIVDPSALSRPRLLFVLKDPSTDEYRQPEYLDDLRRWILGPPRSYGSTWLNVARWASAVLDEPGVSIDQAPCRNVAARGVLRRIAVVNLKKSAFKAGGTSNGTADEDMLHAYARRDEDFLRRQFALIQPDVIIGCGVHRPLIWLLDLAPAEVSRISTQKKARQQVYLIRASADGPTVILTRHPGRAPANPSNCKSVGEELRDVWAEASQIAPAR